MTIYQYSGDSPIVRVRFAAAPNRDAVALIEAGNKADSDKLAEVVETMQARGWQALPVFAEGKEQLQVTGFKQNSQITSLLAESGLAQGEPQVMQVQDEAKTQQQGWIKRNSLKAAGLLNLVGDVGWLFSARQEDNKYKLIGGTLYTLGALNLTAFGGVKRDNQAEVLQGTAEVLKQSGGTVAADSALAQATKGSERTSSIGRFLRQNAAQNTLLVYTGGAAALLGAGIQEHHRNPKMTGGLWYGASSLAIKVGSLMIPEKRQVDEGEDVDKPKNPVAWIKEKPLRLFGYGSLLTDSFMAMTTYQKYKHAPPEKNARAWTALTTGTYMASDLMMAVSSKNPANALGQMDKDQQLHVEAVTADAIVRAPKGKRQALIKKAAGYMAGSAEMRGSRDAIEKALAEQVEHRQKNPWAARMQKDESATAQR